MINIVLTGAHGFIGINLLEKVLMEVNDSKRNIFGEKSYAYDFDRRRYCKW